MLKPTDLIRIAELIKLGAETARAFSDSASNGKLSKISDAVRRIEVAADELIEAGWEMERDAPKTS